MKEKKARRGISHSIAAKITAFLLAVFMLCLTAVAVVGAVIMFKAEVYWTSREANLDDVFSMTAYNDAYNIMHLLISSEHGENNADEFIKYTNIGSVQSESANPNFRKYSRKLSEVDERFVYTYYWHVKFAEDGSVDLLRSIGNDYDPEEYPPESVCSVTVGVAANRIELDDYFWYGLLIDVLYIFRFWIYPIGAAAFLIALISIAFLMVSAGRRRGIDGVSPTVLTNIPFEIPTAIYAALMLFGLMIVVDIGGDIETAIALSIFYVVGIVASLVWFMSFAIRVKLGTLIKNTIIFRFMRLLWRAIRFLGRCIAAFVRSIPMIWKTLILLAVVAIVEFFVIALTHTEVDNMLIWWLIGKLIGGAAVIYFAIMLRRLKTGGRKIADGDLEYKVKTDSLILDLKDHGEDLNRIGEGLNLAVEERIRSERMKTELITNVSHDIKTPLTSIINYSDLICREECDNENIKEYASVLHNQSERMKRLIEDLVEASKASSGNIEIELAECNACVLVSQVSGEYSQRLSDAGLELVCTAPEESIRIMADGRRIWRVFDNLMGNARKYALPGTRVYVSLEEEKGAAVFRFRNISREALSLDARELTERFVRGDASRNTEGNGLGLSIAKSLTELQGGSFDITVDGDLFKVTLTFPAIK